MPLLGHKCEGHSRRIAVAGVDVFKGEHVLFPIVLPSADGGMLTPAAMPAANRWQLGRGPYWQRLLSRLRERMDAKTFDKAKLPSRHVTEGPARAPHRSYYYAMGLTEEQIHRPFVGVVSCWNEAAPCNIALMRQAQSAKRGVHEAGGTPREFCTSITR